MEQTYMKEKPILPLLLSMALPMVLSMMVNSLYNIIDSYFVAKINENAMTALSLVFPVQNLITAVGVGFGIGINATIAYFLGAQKQEEADTSATLGIACSFLHGVILTIGTITIMPAFLSMFTKEQEILSMGITYSRITFGFSVIISLGVAYEKIFQSVGRMKTTMFCMMSGCILNIILDPILIFGYFGMPRMGIAGAAVATVIGQIVAAFMALWFNLKFNKELDISMKGFRPNGHLIGQIYKVGAPSIVVQAIGSLMTYGMNLILASFGSAQTVFGIYFKLQSFVFMPVFGLNNGMVPIIAYNYGAGHKDRVIKTIKHSVAYGVGIMCVGLIVMHIFPAQLMRMFDEEESLIAIGIPALETISLSFVFAGFCIVVGSVFQALGNGVYSMIVSVARQMCVLLPVAKLLSLSGEVTLIWWAFPIAELASLLLSTHFLVRIYKKIICHIGEPVTTREITE